MGNKNEIRELFIKLGYNQNLVIGGTLFPHRIFIKLPGNHPTKKKIGISKKQRSCLMNTKTYQEK